MSFFKTISDAAPPGPYRPVAALLFGVTLLFLGQGVFLILVPLRLTAEGLGAIGVSMVGAAYFFGIVCGALFGDRIVRSVGNVRAYAGSTALIICAALSLALAHGALAWTLLRFLHGWAAATTFLAIESWLHAATPDRWRGRVIGAYTALTLVGLGGGQLLINIYGAAALASIDLGAILFALSIIPVVLSKASAPPLPLTPRRSPTEIYRRSPLAAAGCICAGLCMGAFWALGPVFAKEAGLVRGATSLFMATVIAGGLSLVWPFGRLSDRIDRRLVVAGVSALGAVAALLITLYGEEDLTRFYGLAFLFGGVIFSLYPLSVSQAADRLPSDQDMLQVTRGLLLANGFGTASGPLIAGAGMERIGIGGFFYFPASVLAFLCVLALWRALARPPVPAELRKPFIHLPETTPAGLSMDPRAAPPEPELDLKAEKQPSSP